MQSPQQRAIRILGHLQPNLTSGSDKKKAKSATDAKKPEAVPSAGYKYIQIEKRGRVGIIRLFRPQALNALCDALILDLNKALDHFENEQGSNIGCLVLTGYGRAFAAGADIKEMKDKSYYQMSSQDKIGPWERLSKCKLPVIAAVNGFALGGGCEIAMMCDIIIAADNAKFGQPEIAIGTIPGAGGTQRLTRAVGKSKAMEMVLSGNMVDAKEAEKFGLVSKVVPADKLIEETLKLADRIASLSRPLVILAKESVLSAYNTTLNEGMHIERRLFHSTFALNDQKEGMAAFSEKRAPKFTHT